MSMFKLILFYELGEMIDDGNRWRGNAGENAKLSNLYIFTSLTIIQKLYACTLLHTELWIISIKQDEAVPVVQIKLMRNKYRVGWLVPCAK